MQDIRSYVNCFNYKIYNKSYDELINLLNQRMTQNKTSTVFAINPNKVMMAKKNIEIDQLLQSADILIPDGSGIIMAAKWMNQSIPYQITGIDLMEALCRLAQTYQYGVYLYGAKKENLYKACCNLKSRYPSLHLAGSSHGYLENQMKVVQSIRDSKADILFTGLGSPAQEKFIIHYRTDMPNVKIFLGVGGAIDVFSGNVKRAPKWVQQCHGEWLYRFASQPSRIVQKNNILPFIIYSLRLSMRKEKYENEKD